MTLINRYHNAVEETRLFTEVFVDALVFTYDDTKERINRTTDILTGRAEPTDTPCQMKHCTHQSIGLFPRHDDWKDDVSVCRFHWVTLHVMIRLVLALLIVGLLGSPFLMLVIFG